MVVGRRTDQAALSIGTPREISLTLTTEIERSEGKKEGKPT